MGLRISSLSSIPADMASGYGALTPARPSTESVERAELK
jgi:hypothetical protein